MVERIGGNRAVDANVWCDIVEERSQCVITLAPAVQDERRRRAELRREGAGERGGAKEVWGALLHARRWEGGGGGGGGLYMVYV
jgi:hypothetical protein